MSTPAKRAANARYASKLDQLRVQPSREIGAAIRAAAAASGQSVQRYILDAVRERMAREGSTSATTAP